MTDPYAETDTWPDPPASQQPARPATLAASEPSRVAGEGSDAQAPRVAAYAEAIRACYDLDTEVSEQEWDERVACAVMAVADAEQAELRESLDLWGRLYREAVGVPASEHQQRRMDQVAAEWERAKGEAAELRAEVERVTEDRDRWQGAADFFQAEADAALAEVTELRDRLGLVDESNARYFQSGWEAAVREAFLRFDAGQAEDFRHEQRAALAVPVTGDTETASPAAEDAAPSVLGMVEEIYRREDADHEPFFRDKVTGEPCPRRGNVLCTLPYSPDHRHVAAHMRDTGAASPTEQATEGGACESCGHPHSPHLAGICIGCPCS